MSYLPSRHNLTSRITASLLVILYILTLGPLKETLASVIPQTPLPAPILLGSQISNTIYIEGLYEKTGSTVTKHIFAGANRIATVSLRGSEAAEAIYYHPDHLGSSNVITNASGAQAQLAEYKPYGTLSRDELANPQTDSPVNYLFTGKELDSTGLYYYGARYYDPKIGRFITPDPLIQDLYDPQTLNSYTYCRNNPLRYIDPTGNYSVEDGWKDWNNYATTNYFMRSVGGFTLGFANSVLNAPIGFYNLVTNPIGSIAGIPASLQATKEGLLSPDVFTYAYTIGNIAGGIETGLAMGYGGKTIRTNFASRIPQKSSNLLYGPRGPNQFVTELTETQRAFRWDWGPPNKILASGFDINNKPGLLRGPGVYFAADPVSSIKTHGPYLYSAGIPKNSPSVISYSSIESSNAIRSSTWYNVTDPLAIDDIVYLGERP